MKKASVKLSDVLKFSFWGAKIICFFAPKNNENGFTTKKLRSIL